MLYGLVLALAASTTNAFADVLRKLQLQQLPDVLHLIALRGAVAVPSFIILVLIGWHGSVIGDSSSKRLVRVDGQTSSLLSAIAVSGTINAVTSLMYIRAIKVSFRSKEEKDMRW